MTTTLTKTDTAADTKTAKTLHRLGRIFNGLAIALLSVSLVGSLGSVVIRCYASVTSTGTYEFVPTLYRLVTPGWGAFGYLLAAVAAVVLLCGVTGAVKWGDG